MYSKPILNYSLFTLFARSTKNHAPSEDRTRDLQITLCITHVLIMRLTRCLLRYRGTYKCNSKKWITIFNKLFFTYFINIISHKSTILLRPPITSMLYYNHYYLIIIIIIYIRIYYNNN